VLVAALQPVCNRGRERCGDDLFRPHFTQRWGPRRRQPDLLQPGDAVDRRSRRLAVDRVPGRGSKPDPGRMDRVPRGDEPYRSTCPENGRRAS